MTATVNVGTSPRGIAIMPNSTYALVTNLGTDEIFKPSNLINSSISVISTVANKVTSTIQTPLGSTPYAMAITSDGEYAYITNGGLGTVSVINIVPYTSTIYTPDLIPPVQLLIIAVLVAIIAVLAVVIVVKKKKKAKSNPTSSKPTPSLSDKEKQAPQPTRLANRAKEQPSLFI